MLTSNHLITIHISNVITSVVQSFMWPKRKNHLQFVHKYKILQIGLINWWLNLTNWGGIKRTGCELIASEDGRWYKKTKLTHPYFPLIPPTKYYTLSPTSKSMIRMFLWNYKTIFLIPRSTPRSAINIKDFPLLDWRGKKKSMSKESNLLISSFKGFWLVLKGIIKLTFYSWEIQTKERNLYWKQQIINSGK